ncbi:MAG: NADH-quinone oxidoreductase subunit M [Oligoflexales bacterium]|nr:NADH-quinone oxidoreductase subunit M [Oligoflexales bacterium]
MPPLFLWLNSHVLSLLIFTPLLGTLALLFPFSLKQARALSFISALVCFFLALHVAYYFKPSASLQFVESYRWIPSFGIQYLVGVDGINLLLLVFTTFLTPCVLLSLWESSPRYEKSFLALILALETGVIGALLAMDLVFFYVFWEAMLIPMYFMVGLWGGKNKIYASTQFMLYTIMGSLLMLVAVICLYILHFEQFGYYSTSILDLYKIRNLPVSSERLLFFAFALAFAVKIPVWPFHTWLPHTHTEAPTSGSVLLAGILLKMGTYGFLRLALPLFPHAATEAAPLFAALGTIGIVYGALMAWMQLDAKRLVAYSSVSHLGFVVLGSMCMFQGQLSEEALIGANYQMICHGLSTGALFFLIGSIYERRHTRLLSDFGGLAKPMPIFAIFLVLATLGSVGLPGTGGFIGEFLILIGVFQLSPIVAIFAGSGVVLGAVYMLTFCGKIIFGPLKHKENENLKDLSWIERSYLIPLSVMILITGIYPNLFLDKVKPSLNYFVKNINSYHLLIEAEDGEKTP